MQFSTADIAAMISAMGEPATMMHKASTFRVSGIYAITQGGVSPLDGRNIRPGVYYTCAESNVAGIEPGWQCDIRGQILPVIAAVPDGAGFIELYLGDPND